MPAKKSELAKVALSEVFFSIQGEGQLVGCPQLFIRVGQCNLQCTYCDTDFVAGSHCSTPWGQVLNPISAEQIMANAFPGPYPIHSVSFTGGEPLLFPEFIQAFAEQCSHKIYLETNGTLPKKLLALDSYLDYISMDWKLDPSLWAIHTKFLEIALASNADTFIKIVYRPDQQELLSQALQQINAISATITIFLQPQEPQSDYQQCIQTFYQMIQHHECIRFIPQIHKWLGVR